MTYDGLVLFVPVSMRNSQAYDDQEENNNSDGLAQLIGLNKRMPYKACQSRFFPGWFVLSIISECWYRTVA